MTVDQITLFILSYFVTIFIVVFVFKIPFYIVEGTGILNEYYYDNFTYAIILDLLLCMIYFSFGIFIIKQFNNDNIIINTIIIALSSFLLTTTIYYIISNTPKTNNIFNRWIHTTGLKSAIFDAIYLSVLYLIYIYLQNIIVN